MSLGSDADEELVKEPKVPIPEVSRFHRRDWTLIPVLITLICRWKGGWSEHLQRLSSCQSCAGLFIWILLLTLRVLQREAKLGWV